MPGLKLGATSSILAPTWVTEAQVLALSSTLFPGTSSGSWMRSEVAGTQTSTWGARLGGRDSLNYLPRHTSRTLDQSIQDPNQHSNLYAGITISGITCCASMHARPKCFKYIYISIMGKELCYGKLPFQIL